MKRANPNLILIGMMGSGKTEIGRLISRKLGMTFIDTDALIYERIGVEISEIFKYGGEASFRKIERDALASLQKRKSCVISTGGGIVTSPANRKLLAQLGIVFYLNVALEVLYHRLSETPQSTRPLLKGGKKDLKKNLKSIMEARQGLYMKACDAKVDIISLMTNKHAVARRVISMFEELRRA